MQLPRVETFAQERVQLVGIEPPIQIASLYVLPTASSVFVILNLGEKLPLLMNRRGRRERRVKREKIEGVTNPDLVLVIAEMLTLLGQ